MTLEFVLIVGWLCFAVGVMVGRMIGYQTGYTDGLLLKEDIDSMEEKE